MKRRLHNLPLNGFLAAVFGCVGFSAGGQTNEFRGLWADAWGTGFQTASQVTTLVNDLRVGNFNAVIPQVRRRGDAFYNSNFEPKNPGISASFDPLADIITKCHNPANGQRIEVHAWIVTYHIAQVSSPPSDPLHPYNLHPDWLLEDVNGATAIGGEYTFDPGHPEVQQHTYNVCMDIISNYDVDGLNFDYIRYSGSDMGYNPVTVARFNQRYGRAGQPSPSDAAWKQFRRDQVTGLLRKVYLNAIALKPNVKISADTITWAPGPASLSAWYSSSAAWNSVLQDWRGWMEEGILDLNIPMAYFDQAGAYTSSWINWCNFARDHQYNRHSIIGPGIYLNSVADAISQMRYTRVASPLGNSGRGVCGYSYRVTNKEGVPRSTFIDALVNPSGYDPVTPPMFQQQATIPVMPWKASPSLGHLKGTVSTGDPTNGLDGALVTLSGPANRIQTNDATGFYGFVDLPPGIYTVQASYPGYESASTNVTIGSGAVATRDLVLSLTGPPAIVAQPSGATNYEGAPVSFTVSAAGAAPLAYHWRKDGTPLPGSSNTTYMITAITPVDAGGYDVVVTNVHGAVTSSVALLEVIIPPPNQRLVPLWSLAPGSRSYITSGNTERGLSHNPVTDRLLVVSRAASPTVHVLDSINGADLHALNNGSGVISGGTYTLNMIGVADDGAVYVCNLTVNGSTSDLKLYRWANDNPSTAPTVAYAGNVDGSSDRWGDTMDVRGSGTGTQILLGSRSGTTAALFTTANGTTFTAHPISVSGGVAGMFGLGISFGEGNTFWGKSSSLPLRQIAFSPGAGIGSVIQSFDSPTTHSSMRAISVNTSLDLLGGVVLDTPDNFQLYNLPSAGTPGLIETNVFPADNDNVNGTGSVDFADDRVFALDTQNGILALRILPPLTAPSITSQPSTQNVRVGLNATFTVAADGFPAPSYQWQFDGLDIGGATSPSYTRLNVQPGDGGNYSVVITNAAGSVTSSNALLTVTPWATVRFETITPLPDGPMRLEISGEPGEPLWIDATEALPNWQSMTNVTMTNGTVEFTDHDATNHPRRWYRARQ